MYHIIVSINSEKSQKFSDAMMMGELLTGDLFSIIHPSMWWWFTHHHRRMNHGREQSDCILIRWGWVSLCNCGHAASWFLVNHIVEAHWFDSLTLTNVNSLFPNASSTSYEVLFDPTAYHSHHSDWLSAGLMWSIDRMMDPHNSSESA